MKDRRIKEYFPMYYRNPLIHELKMRFTSHVRTYYSKCDRYGYSISHIP